MMRVLPWSGGAQDGANNTAGPRPSPETPVVPRFRYRTPVGLEPAGTPGFSDRWTACSRCCVVWATLARPRSMTRMRRARLRWRAVQRAAGQVTRAKALRRKGSGQSRAAAASLFRGAVGRGFIVGHGRFALSNGPGDRLQTQIPDASRSREGRPLGAPEWPATTDWKCCSSHSAGPRGMPRVFCSSLALIACIARGQRPSLRRLPPLSAFSDPRIFSLDDRSPRLDRSPDRVRTELNQGFICKQNFLCIRRKAGLPKGNGLLDGSADELRAVLPITKGLIQTPNGRSIQPQCSLKVQTFWACHTQTIRRIRIFLQIDTYWQYGGYLPLTFRVSLISMQLMSPVVRVRPFSRRESARC